jgi:hypothetical protein
MQNLEVLKTKAEIKRGNHPTLPGDSQSLTVLGICCPICYLVGTRRTSDQSAKGTEWKCSYARERPPVVMEIQISMLLWPLHLATLGGSYCVVSFDEIRVKASTKPEVHAFAVPYSDPTNHHKRTMKNLCSSSYGLTLRFLGGFS